MALAKLFGITAEEFLKEVKGMFVYSICNLWL